ncbi:MAG: hypothetical protein A3H95_13460 [Acidobacteria bacterium RIFCSPLOWO2_02_FULL_64_15]|nr:MAG: hypothetical protein A3H95_13460 [Acidobacteria bacterium RIFCSPLOWO2_02_FULL_64_15]
MAQGSGLQAQGFANSVRALLISTYDLGRQPVGLASPAAWLRNAGWDVDCVDLAKDRLREASVSGASLIGVHLPMHTATRLAGPIIEKARRLNASARLCAYGLYAPPNESWLRSLGVDEVLGGEFEGDLVDIARAIANGVRRPDLRSGVKHSSATAKTIPRLQFLVPDRSGLPPLSRYATLHMPDGTRKVVGSTDASRGCKHLCRHCPVVPIYQGQFRVVSPDVVAADIDALVAAGAQHITFGDPDFFNGPTHAMRIITALHAAHPSVSYDVTIKIEHLLQHRLLLPRLMESGCAFVTSAVESIDDCVLGILDKGHTRADFIEAVALCRDAGVALVPTFVAFHPWLTLDDYCDLVDTIEALDVVEHVAPIQLAIRLLVPEGSRLLELEDFRQRIGRFDPATLTYRWSHADPRVEELHRDVTTLVGVRLNSGRAAIFDEISTLAHERAGTPRPSRPRAGPRAGVPYLSEPWYCCAEPNPEQVSLV